MKREKRKTRDLYGGRSEGEWFSIWGINATVCARLDLRLFAPLAFLFLEGDEMERERERRGLGFMQQQQSLSPTCEWCSFNDALR